MKRLLSLGVVILACVALAAASGAHAQTLPGHDCTSLQTRVAPNTTVSAGTPVVIAAGADCGGAVPVYRFWLQGPTVGWHIVQPYSTSTRFTFQTAGAEAGNWRVAVDVERQGESNADPNFYYFDQQAVRLITLMPAVCGVP